jgi:hypothetical protein
MTTPIANFSSPEGWVLYASQATGGWFWSLLLLSVFVISFSTLVSKTSVSRAFAAASFFNGILAAFLYVIGGIDGVVAVISVALTIAGFMMVLFERQ